MTNVWTNFQQISATILLFFFTSELEESERELAELKMLEEMDEEEYDELPDDVKIKIDYKMLLLKKDRIRR